MIGRLVTTSLAAGMLLAACGGSSDEAMDPATPATTAGTQSPTPTVSASAEALSPGGDHPVCQLLSAGEVGDALGAPVAEGTPISAATCSWSAQAGQMSVSLAVAPTKSAAACRAGISEGAQEASGLGADAWWDFVQAEVGVGNIVACAPDSVVILTVTGAPDEAAARSTAEVLTASVLRRLP